MPARDSKEASGAAGQSMGCKGTGHQAREDRRRVREDHVALDNVLTSLTFLRMELGLTAAC